MGAFLGISLWVALATVVPGLITLALIYAAIIVVNPDLITSYSEDLKNLNNILRTPIKILNYSASPVSILV